MFDNITQITAEEVQSFSPQTDPEAELADASKGALLGAGLIALPLVALALMMLLTRNIDLAVAMMLFVYAQVSYHHSARRLLRRKHLLIQVCRGYLKTCKAPLQAGLLPLPLVTLTQLHAKAARVELALVPLTAVVVAILQVFRAYLRSQPSDAQDPFVLQLLPLASLLIVATMLAVMRASNHLTVALKKLADENTPTDP